MDQQVALDGFVMEERPCLPPQQQGQLANMAGKRAEATIYCMIKELGYRVERQYPICIGIHGGQMNADLYVHPTKKFPKGIIIESKWQGSSGSADEKFCFLELNIRTRYPAPTIVVLDGGGARPGMVEWFKAQVDGQKLIGVLSLMEFLLWVNHNL